MTPVQRKKQELLEAMAAQVGGFVSEGSFVQHGEYRLSLDFVGYKDVGNEVRSNAFDLVLTGIGAKS